MEQRKRLKTTSTAERSPPMASEPVMYVNGLRLSYAQVEVLAKLLANHRPLWPVAGVTDDLVVREAHLNKLANDFGEATGLIELPADILEGALADLWAQYQEAKASAGEGGGDGGANYARGCDQYLHSIEQQQQAQDTRSSTPEADNVANNSTAAAAAAASEPTMSANDDQHQGSNNPAGPSNGSSTASANAKDNFLLVDPAVIMLLKLRGVELKKKSIVITPITCNNNNNNNNNNKKPDQQPKPQ